MIVKPELPFHPKFIALRRDLGPGAAEILLRLWGHCQQLGTSCLGKVDPGYIKAITGYGGAEAKLWQALAIAKVGGKASWLDVDETGLVWVHQFDEINKSLRICRENGKRGGRPPANPPANPPVTPSANPPDRDGMDGKDRMEGSGRKLARETFNSMYGRHQSQRWECIEEQTLEQLLRRPEFPAELQAVQAYREGLPADRRKFFPQSLSALLTRWAEVLDRANLEAGDRKNAPPNGQWQPGDQDWWWTAELAAVERAWDGACIGALGSGDTKKRDRLKEIVTLRKAGR